MTNKQNKVLLSLGSNIGEREDIINEAINTINNNYGINVNRAGIYETEPVGYLDQNWFLNTCILMETKVNPENLLKYLKNLEIELGRQHRERWKEREIDIDILLYEDKVIENNTIEVPHPRMHKRKFVLVPAVDIAGEMKHPKLNMNLNELLVNCEDESEVLLFKE